MGRWSIGASLAVLCSCTTFTGIEQAATDGSSSSSGGSTTTGGATGSAGHSGGGGTSDETTAPGTSTTDTPESSGPGETGIAAGCGDGVLDPGEFCDSPNDDELDGCTNACTRGPIGLLFSDPPVLSPLDGAGGGANQSVEMCPEGGVLVGLSGRLTTQYWIGVIRGVCRVTGLTNEDPPAFVASGPTTPLPQHGGYGQGGDWATVCADDEAIVAVRGYAGSVIDRLQVQCARLDTVGDPGAHDLAVVETAWLPYEGNEDGGNEFSALTCPVGTIATGLESHTNSYVLRLRLHCRALDLAYER